MSSRRVTQFGERGMVSFLVTLIMMIVITLIVIGFSQVTRRSARESLDRQLSTQAFYAAESGINVTEKAISNYITSTGSTNLVAKTTCANDYSATIATGVAGGIAPLSSANKVQYTCVLVNPTPINLQFPATQTDSVVMPMTADSTLKTMTVTWSAQGLNGSSKLTCSGGTDTVFTPSGIWGSDCDLGVLRLDLLQNPGTAVTTGYTGLDSNTITMFLTPRGTHSGTKTVAFGPTTGYVVSGYDATTNAGVCSSGVCKAVITLPNNTASYMIRATMLYKEADSVSISGTTASGAAKFSGSQAVVDVTGQDQDELRRVQVRVSLTSSGSQIPANAVASSSDICKNFTILPTDSLDLSTVADCH